MNFDFDECEKNSNNNLNDLFGDAKEMGLSSGGKMKQKNL